MTQRNTDERLATLEEQVALLLRFKQEQETFNQEQETHDIALFAKVDSIGNGLRRLERSQIRGFEELRANHGELRANHGELRTNHGELRTNHEELRANHEELRANHKELRTSYEQLRASQEQLRANQEQLRIEMRAGHEYLTMRLDTVEDDLTQVVEMGVKHREAIDMLLEGQQAHTKAISSLQTGQQEVMASLQQIVEMLMGKPRRND